MWCECCLGRLWQHLNQNAKEFLLLLAESPGEWLGTDAMEPLKQKAALNISKAVMDCELGVLLPEGVRQIGPSHQRWRSGLPYSFDEVTASYKHYLLHPTGAALVTRFSQQDSTTL